MTLGIREATDADRVDQRQRATGPGRKAPAEDRTDIAVFGVRYDPLFEAAGGFQRLDMEDSLFESFFLD